MLHSFFVPAFRVKQDVLPNRYSAVWFEATRVDTFQVFCTEYCGMGHSVMLASVITHSQGDFEAWLASAGVDEDTPLPELGAQLYQQQACIGCHTLDGTEIIGPTFAGLYGRPKRSTTGPPWWWTTTTCANPLLTPMQRSCKDMLMCLCLPGILASASGNCPH